MAEFANKTEDDFQIIKSGLEDESSIDEGKTYICSSCGKQYGSNSEDTRKCNIIVYLLANIWLSMV